MPHSLSAKKRHRQNIKHREINQARKGTLKSQIRRFVDAVQSKDAASAEKELPQVAKVLDQVAAKRTIHPNKAARKKSRLQKRLNQLKSAAN